MFYDDVDYFVVVSIIKNFGEDLVLVFVNRMKVVYVEIFVGDRYINKWVNFVLVFFVLVLFIVLMVILFVWLVFYYV